MVQFAEIPNLRHLRMVQYIGIVGGISAAAREANASQPAVTQALSNVEALMGAALFERSAIGAQPTPLGSQFLLRVDRFFEILDAALMLLMGRHSTALDRGRCRADRLITHKQLRAVIVVSEYGRVADIAHGLGLSPAGVFRTARSLERSLGKQLFDRTAQGPILNMVGKAFVREARRASRELELARGEISLASGAESLDVVIGSLPMSGSHELTEAVRCFMAIQPAVRVRLVTGEYSSLLTDLLNCRIDMIFGMLRRPEWAVDVREEILFQDSYCVVAQPSHPLASSAKVMPADLVQYPWVVPAVGTPRRARIEGIFGNLDPRPKFLLETSSLTIGRAMLLGSNTLTLMTKSEVRHDLDHGILFELPCLFLRDILPKGVTTRQDWLPTRAHTSFLEQLRKVTSSRVHKDLRS